MQTPASKDLKRNHLQPPKFVLSLSDISSIHLVVGMDVLQLLCDSLALTMNIVNRAIAIHVPQCVIVLVEANTFADRDSSEDAGGGLIPNTS